MKFPLSHLKAFPNLADKNVLEEHRFRDWAWLRAGTADPTTLVLWSVVGEVCSGHAPPSLPAFPTWPLLFPFVLSVLLFLVLGPAFLLLLWTLSLFLLLVALS